MAAADPLTGLHNRRYLEALLGALLGQTRPDRLPLCATSLDLDDFKSVNDRHGGTGDQVLQAFAARAKRIIRGTDILCRLGGHEFVIIMPGTSLRTGYGIAEEIRAAGKLNLYFNARRPRNSGHGFGRARGKRQ
jgi:two-component system, cell cycle response regulator